MAENKKYYWLKLMNDFFTQPRIKKLRKIAGGDTYTIIYLKLQLLSLKNNGVLIFEEIEDNVIEELALTIDEEVDDVPEEELNEEIDETYGMPETDNQKLNEKFISMNENMDINALGASLSQQAAIQRRTESAGDTRLAQVQARAEMLQNSINKKVDEKIASTEEQQAESFVQSEELEIVDVEEPTQPVENVKSTPAAKSTKKVSKKKKSK